MRRRVVVTGMGAVTPIGNTVTETWEAARAGKCGIGLTQQLDVTQHKIKISAEVKNLSVEEYLDKKTARKMSRYRQLAMIAAKQAYQDSGLAEADFDHTRMGVIVSSGVGGMDAMENEHIKALEKGYDRLSPFFVTQLISNMGAGDIAIEFNAKGICTCTVTACASGSNAVGDAFHRVRDGYEEIMITGGAESTITHLALGGFTSMKALHDGTDITRASIPFDKERSGFVMGEGAGILILEELEHAKARGAKIYGEMVGYGSTCDAFHITLPSESGEGAARSMICAMTDAGISPEQVDYINAHGTSTPPNDKFETMAIKTALGDYAYKVSISSTKSMTGHLLGATGAVESIFSILALKEGFVPPTINYQVPDPECDLDITPNVGKEKEMEYALSNTFGFGGHNATLAFRKYKGE